MLMQRSGVNYFGQVLVGFLALAPGLVLAVIGGLGTLQSLTFYVFGYGVEMSPAVLGATSVTLLLHPLLFMLGFYLSHRGGRVLLGKSALLTGKRGPLLWPDWRYALAVLVVYLLLMGVRLLLS
ncbi:hypothetical protein ABMA57_16185 [Saccharospirillum sp. HFRX-1]|uniref:hypothetical protein n=1 Tax=unclassified Saccharospirillum TaxID=2633430 RepID=UPI003713AB4F